MKTQTTANYMQKLGIGIAALAVFMLAGCGGGTGPTGTPVNAPAPPTTVSAGALSDKSVQIRWTDNSSDETGFSIERSPSATGTFTQVGTATINATSHIDSGLTPATAYHYRLKATGSTGDSAYTAVATANTPASGGVALAPLAPSGLTVIRPSVAQVGAPPALNVAWTDNSSDETAFLIERASSTAGPFVQITAAAANVIFFQDAGLMSATTHWLRRRLCWYRPSRLLSC